LKKSSKLYKTEKKNQKTESFRAFDAHSAFHLSCDCGHWSKFSGAKYKVCKCI